MLNLHPHPLHSHTMYRHIISGIFGCIVFSAVSIAQQPAQPSKSATPSVSATTTESFPTAEELKKNWPSFRGANGSGVASTATLPTAWNAKAGILWKTPIPVEGVSSPVVWEKNVFITGATPEESRVLCYDAETGALRWSSVVTVPGGKRPPAPEVNESTTLAAPTPVTDGRRVYAVFPTGEVAAFDLTGKQIWARNIGPLGNSYGFAASPTLHQNRLILQLDLDSSEPKSQMLALDTLTGKELWKTPRPTSGTWASPVLAEIKSQPQLITCGNPFVIGYNPADGKELWRIKALENDVAPSPIVVGNKVIAIASTALALDSGTSTPVWHYDDCVPDVTSPVSDGQYVYLLTTGGDLHCIEAQTGKKVWSHELEGKFSASPVIVGKTLLLLSEGGVAYLVETGGKYKELGRGEIDDDGCIASPAPVGKRLYIRGKLNLFCIGSR